MIILAVLAEKELEGVYGAVEVARVSKIGVVAGVAA